MVAIWARAVANSKLVQGTNDFDALFNTTDDTRSHNLIFELCFGMDCHAYETLSSELK